MCSQVIFIVSENTVTVFADSRETAAVISELEKLCAVKKICLSCGDYVCSDRAVIERKTASDFAISVADGRLFRQLNALRVCRKPILLIEKDGFPPSGMHPSAVRGALVSIALDFNIPVLFSDSAAESAAIIFQIAKREQSSLKRPAVVMRSKKKESAGAMQELLVAGLPGISSVLAKRLLAHFKTPENIFMASEEELRDVNGIGGKKAKMIFGLVREEHSGE